MSRLSSILTICALLALSACQVTDYSDKPEKLDNDLINIPGSGYDGIPEEEMPKMVFEEERIDVGDISQGTVVRETFTFKNTAKRPLLINDVKTTCGCTAGKDWPTHPIEPGDKGTITVSFDSEGKTGFQDKPVSIIANTSPETTVVRLIANVKAPK